MMKPSNRSQTGWLVVALLGILLGTALLLGLDTRGAEVAGVLSLTVAVLLPLIANTGGGNRLPLAKAAGIAVLLGALVAGAYALYLDQRSIDIAAKAAVEPGTLAVGDPDHPDSAEVKLVLDPKEDRRKLEIGFHITEAEEHEGSKYCSPEAKLEVTGSGGKSVMVDTGRSAEIEIDPDPVRNPVTVRLEINSEPVCVVDVAVATAVLNK